MTWSVDVERDLRIRAHAARTTERCDAAVAFVLRLVFLVLFIAAGVWALLTYFEPCAAATLCSAVPLIRQPHVGTGPRWWQRLVLRFRVLRLQARHRTMLSDVEWLQRELALTRNLLDACQADADEAGEQAAWARSDLAKLQ